jgi:Helicase conserved C-terminal domain
MLCSSNKRKELVAASSVLAQRRRIDVTSRLEVRQLDNYGTGLFLFSPFGLCCHHANCKKHPQIKADYRSVQIHLRKHKLDSRESHVRLILDKYASICHTARVSGTLVSFQHDNKIYPGYACLCGQVFARRDNATRHCQKIKCDITKLQKVSLFRFCCGRYVTQSQIDTFLDESPRVRQQLMYSQTRAVLVPFLLENEKHEDTYTHMFTPLVSGCHDVSLFVEKIKNDFISIHAAPDVSTERRLLSIHQQAEEWLLTYAQKNISLVPANFRAGLQTFDGGEINELSHGSTYAMQHHPNSLLPELKKLLSFAYRRGLFATRRFHEDDAFSIAHFLKDLMLEAPQSVASLPFVVEFCLMFAFRVQKKDSKITMISCDHMSSIFAKISSLLKAAVCSVICSFSENAFTVGGPTLVRAVRVSPVLHILSPMIRQLREMNQRIPKRRKTTVDSMGNITVDQFSFPFDEWSEIAPRTVDMMRLSISKLANGLWWETVVDVATTIKVRVDEKTGEMDLIGCEQDWKQGQALPLDELDTFTSILEMAFHGFGGGSARMKELSRPTMLHCFFTNNSIYYSMLSLKKFNHASQKFRQVERKLPPIIGRYFLLFRSLIKANQSLFIGDDVLSLIFPRQSNKSDYGASNVIRDLFTLDSVPHSVQVRHFWACVSNFITGGEQRIKYLTASNIGSTKMGHSKYTHARVYSSEMVDQEESHYNAYHFAIGDTSYQYRVCQSSVSLVNIRSAMQLRYPTSLSIDGHNYLSLQQKELVELGYGCCKPQHCIGLLAPGGGKSDCFIIPTIARDIANLDCKMIIHVSPYRFLAGYQHASALLIFENLGLSETIRRPLFFTGSDIQENGSLPVELSGRDHLPSLLFLNLDAMYNLFTYFREDLKSWVGSIDKIVLDEVHTMYSEIGFRHIYKIFFELSVLGIPIFALSGSVPLFAVSRMAKRFCLSVKDDLSDVRVVHGDDIVGFFPKGFKLSVKVAMSYVKKVATFVINRLGTSPSGVSGAAHVFVAEKPDGTRLFNILSKRYRCKFVTSDTAPEEVNQTASEWQKGDFDVLISTSIALVGNENPKCRYLACAGYLYDSMQIVQAFGRLRPYMRVSTGAIMVGVPEVLSDFRLEEDRQRFTRLLNEHLISSDEYSQFQATMTSSGVRKWLIDASEGQVGCALVALSNAFGKKRDNCGACLFCRSIPLNITQQVAEEQGEVARNNKQAAEQVLRKLAFVCLACGKADCWGLPFFMQKGAAEPPENNACCFPSNTCFQCGVSRHSRKECFDKSYLNKKACCECWVFKNVPGAKRHEPSECEVKGRLRRLLSHNYLSSKENKTYQQYIEGIYTSTETFCKFLAGVELKYILKR